MRKLVVPVIAAVMLAALVAIAGRPTAGIAQAQQAVPDALAFNPQMGALMNMFIQPRHAKLGLAGRAENWPLADYAFKELTQSFTKIAAAIPRWKGLPVEELFDAALTEPLAMLDAAIKARDPRQFAEAYGRLTTGCNNCHATTDHSFVVLRVPDASAFPNQAFEKR
jgi:hypothetical protein